MLQIKTITDRLDFSNRFDTEVNDALADGWELVRRDVLPPMAMRNGDQTYSVLYAELEREVEQEAPEEEPENENTAEWVFSRRNPLMPYHCSACGFSADPSKTIPDVCPNCQKIMRRAGK